MTAHIRAQIRAATVDLLKGTELVGSRVFPTRRTPLQTGQIPALLIYALAEDSVIDTMAGPRFLSRDLDLLIEGVAQDNTSLDVVLDGLADIIETRFGTALMDRSSALRQLVRGGSLVRTEIGIRPPQTPDELGTGHIILTYRLNYRTPSHNPNTNT